MLVIVRFRVGDTFREQTETYPGRASVRRCLICEHFNKAFRHVETLFIQGRILYLAGLLLVGGK